MAKELGYYRDVGLDVELLEYNNTNSMKDLEEGKIDFALNNSILVYEDRKLQDVTLLATYFQRSPLVLIAQPEIKNILDPHSVSVSLTVRYPPRKKLRVFRERKQEILVSQNRLDNWEIPGS